MAPNRTPIPMPTLAVLKRPNDDAGEGTGVAGPELVAVSVELFDASAVDAELVAVSVGIFDASAINAELMVDAYDSSIVLDLWESDAVDVEALDVTTVACPSVKRLEGSPQQLSPLSFVQQ